MKTSDVVISVVAIGGMGALVYFTLGSMDFNLGAVGNSVMNIMDSEKWRNIVLKSFEEKYSPEEQKFLNALIEEDEIKKVRKGVVINDGANVSEATRLALAKLECQRGVDDFKVPQSKFDACVEAIKQPHGRWAYVHPGSRYSIEFYL